MCLALLVLWKTPFKLMCRLPLYCILKAWLSQLMKCQNLQKVFVTRFSTFLFSCLLVFGVFCGDQIFEICWQLHSHFRENTKQIQRTEITANCKRLNSGGHASKSRNYQHIYRYAGGSMIYHSGYRIYHSCRKHIVRYIWCGVYGALMEILEKFDMGHNVIYLHLIWTGLTYCISSACCIAPTLYIVFCGMKCTEN